MIAFGILVSVKSIRSVRWLIVMIGSKEYNDEDGFWDDHDPDCHGDPNYLMDESDYEDGYQWSCCERKGSEEGCKQTKHKTAGQPKKKSRLV